MASDSASIVSFVNEWTKRCSFCGACLLKSENNGWCCTRGKYTLPALPPYSPELLSVFDQEGSNLSSTSRKLNNLFCFSILGVTGGFRNLPTPSNVAITGRVYHQILDLSHGEHSIRWFLYDDHMRNVHTRSQGVSPILVDTLRKFLENVNPFVHHLRAAFEGLDDSSIPIALELFTPTAAGEVAALVHANNIQRVHPRSILIYRQHQTRPTVINILNPLYEPLQYPLFFPHGTPGWGLEQDLTQIRWYRARLTVEPRFLVLGRLCGEYLVDMYSRVEDERLDYIRRGREKQYQTLQQQQARDGMLSGDGSITEFERGITLPSSFLGSRAWASQQVADSLAICRAKGKSSFFITITTNPNWPEIKSQLRPGQSASDIPTIVCRVFKARLENAIAKMKLKFGTIVYMVRVIEFQKRGLPHAHIVLKVGQ